MSGREYLAWLRQNLGERARVLRSNAGMTQDDLAKATGMKAHLIAQIESGKADVSLGTLCTMFDNMGYRLTVEMHRKSPPLYVVAGTDVKKGPGR